MHLLEHGQHRLGAERDDARARLELREEQHLVDQLAVFSTSRACLLNELGDVLTRQRGELEQREEAGERRAQLVRDRGREARAQLLVGGEVAGLGEVDEAFLPAVDLVRDDQRALACEQLRVSCSPSRTPERLPRAPAGGEHDAVLVEHDHGLAALLEQHPAARGVWVHHSVTTPSPLDSPSGCMMHGWRRC